MSTIKGYGGSITGGGVNIGELKNFSITETADVVDVSVLGSDWAANTPTLKRWTATFEVHTDVSDTGQDAVDTAFSAGSDLACVFYLGGTSGAGNRSLTGNAVVDNSAITNDVAGVVTRSVSVTGNGALTPADLA